MNETKIKKSISDFILEKSGLPAELTMNILTILSISGLTISYEWIVQQNYFWVVFLAIASVATICFRIWFQFKNKFPHYKTRKVRQVRLMIFAAAFLLAAAQVGSMQILLAEGFSEIQGVKIPSYFGGYKVAGIVLFEGLVPIYCFFIFHKTSKKIEKYDMEGIPIFLQLGWSYS